MAMRPTEAAAYYLDLALHNADDATNLAWAASHENHYELSMAKALRDLCYGMRRLTTAVHDTYALLEEIKSGMPPKRPF